jgi:hypothetical protein
MAAIKSYNMVSTGSITIPVDLATATPDIVYENNIITGSVTLAATVSVVAGGTPSKGQKYVYIGMLLYMLLHLMSMY